MSPKSILVLVMKDTEIASSEFLTEFYQQYVNLVQLLQQQYENELIFLYCRLNHFFACSRSRVLSNLKADAYG